MAACFLSLLSCFQNIRDAFSCTGGLCTMPRCEAEAWEKEARDQSRRCRARHDSEVISPLTWCILVHHAQLPFSEKNNFWWIPALYFRHELWKSLRMRIHGKCSMILVIFWLCWNVAFGDLLKCQCWCARNVEMERANKAGHDRWHPLALYMDMKCFLVS